MLVAVQFANQCFLFLCVEELQLDKLLLQVVGNHGEDAVTLAALPRFYMALATVE